MKTKFIYIAIASCVLLVSSCEKTKQRALYGKVVNKYTKEPVSVVTFSLVVTHHASGMHGTEKNRQYSFATDSNGTFKLMFDANSNETLSIGYPGGPICWAKDIGRKDLAINAGTIEYD